MAKNTKSKRCPKCGRYRARETGWLTKQLRCSYCGAVSKRVGRKPIKKGRIFKTTVGYADVVKIKGGDAWQRNWSQARKQALTRAKYRCQSCRSVSNLEVHHKKPVSQGGTDRLSNLIVLCRDCHRKAHRPKRRGLWGWLFG